MISKSKLDDTFPHVLYHPKDFSNHYGLGKNSHGGIIPIPVLFYKTLTNASSMESFVLETFMSVSFITK